jgi:predicted aminopeptidase
VSRWRQARRWLGRGLAAVLLAAVLLLGGTRTGRYLARAGWEEAGILLGRRPIPALAADPAVDARTRGKLQLVWAARAFAADSLALAAKRSFTRYTDIGRDTLVLVVSAARRDTLAAHTWWFPVVGRVPYKGYFDRGGAEGEAGRLRARGLDTYVRPSAAFSTLGWFDDPLLNTTLAQDSTDLVDTVIHELVHNTFYAPGQAAFNESFASFVGARGAERFFRARGDTASARRAVARWTDQRRLGAFWAAFAASVDSAYAAHPGRATRDSLARVQARAAVEAAARARLARLVAPRLTAFRDTTPAEAQRLGARWAARLNLGNAALLARRTYARELDLFEGVYAREGQDVVRATRRLVALARSRPGDPYGAVRDWLALRPTA